MTTPDDLPINAPEEDRAKHESGQFRRLQIQFLITLACLIVFTGALNLFLLKQTSRIRKEVVNLNEVVRNYETKTAPRIEEFVNALKEFADQNPDFKPVLSKYVEYVQRPQAANPDTNTGLPR
ncbi:MAG: hypothetical protein K9N48_06975 [Verrucomicrobia bacterium]|nr:hypothetical protein [Verrucomicrobiota bacterium]MCF7707559.1 hypothetical protein [Verrucomicrobiota bacterium]